MIGQGSFGKMHCHLLSKTQLLSKLFYVEGSFQRTPVSHDQHYHLEKNWWHAFPMTEFEHRVLQNPQVEAVLVCSPDSEHEKHTRIALQHGKHVFCEKPLSLTADGAERLFDLAMERNLHLQIGFQRRFDEKFHEIRQKFVSGEVRLESFELHSADPFVYNPVEHPLKVMLTNSIIHDIDQALWTLYPFERVEVIDIKHENEKVRVEFKVFRDSQDSGIYIIFQFLVS